MKDKKINTLYYLETFLLLGFFIMLTLVLSKSFVTSKILSNDARELTNAVCVAENVAEVFKASENREEMLRLMEENLNLEVVSANEINVYFSLEMEPEANGYYRVSLLTDEKGHEGEIVVHVGEREVFRLSVGNYPLEVDHE